MIKIIFRLNDYYDPNWFFRVNDLNLGVGMSLADLNKESLMKAIDRVTTDEAMKRRMKEAGKLSEADAGLEKFVDELHLYLTKQKH